jgi:hypothetical protein
MKARFALLLTVILLARYSLTQNRSVPNPALVASVESKLQHLGSSGAEPRPNTASTEFTEQEINAYFASGKVELPAGVRSVAFQEQPGVVIATSRVDFDQLKAGKNSYNPLLSVFSGVHDVVATAHAQGTGGQGLIHVDSVYLDGVEIPNFVLELFVQKYLKPKYPNLGIDSRFALPAGIDSATVGLHKVTVRAEVRICGHLAFLCEL